jgi:hypothetical protein
LLQAAPVDLFSPFYSVDGVDESFLVALNTVTDPVTFEVAALSPSGAVLPLGQYEVQPSRHLWLPLRELIGPQEEEWREGSLRVSFLGDTGTLQAWVVTRRGRQMIEIGLQAPSEAGGNELIAFWDPSDLEGRGALYVVNAGDRRVVYRLVRGAAPGLEGESEGALEPGQRHRIAPSERGERRNRHWVRIVHDGAEGVLLGVALLEGSEHLSLGGLSHGGGGNVQEFEAVSVPLDGSGKASAARARVTLLNTGSEPNRVRIAAVSPITGRPLAEWKRELAAGEVSSVPLSPRLASLLGDLADQEVRVRVDSEARGLLVGGRSVLRDGEVVDLSFFPVQDAHAGGSYPVLPLDEFEVDLALANLDHEDSQVVAQLYWDGGTYAFGPVNIPGGTSYRLSLSELIEHHQPDLLGRSLPKDLPRGFLRWKVQAGSRRLLGRTEARLREGRDRFGFNCYGCCYEVPWGSITPGFVDFEVGQSPLFMSCVSYDTCSGTMGPYPFTPTSLNAPAPFSWNGVNVSASSAAERDLWFLGSEEQFQPDCTTFEVLIDGFGIASACKALLKKAHNSTQFWSIAVACSLQVGDSPPSQVCSRCFSCCNQIALYWGCRRKNPVVIEQDLQVCITTCVIDHDCDN